MIRLSMILAVARAEMRSTRRLARYWLFTLLALLTCIFMFAQFTFLHGMASYQSATIGAVGPRFMISASGMFMIIVFVTGLVFLAFDVRARDERDRMTEILDSRPFSNAELLLGKVSGLVFMIWLPIVLITCAFQAFGTITNLIDFPFGDPIQPWSLAGFLFATLTTLTLWCAIVVLIAVVIRHRLLVGIAALSLVALQSWISFNMPIYLQPMLTFFPSMDVGSDMLPTAFPAGEVPRLLGHWLLAGALLGFAIALHPRRDDQSSYLVVGLGLLVLSCSMLSYHSFDVFSQMNQRDDWRTAHEEKKAEPRGDMQTLAGVLAIDRGEGISLDLVLEIKAPPDKSLSSLLFTLNPGIKITGIEVNGDPAQWHHANGLLEIDHPLSSDAAASIHLTASGMPDESFGYLDTYFDLLKTTATKSQLGTLGSKSSIFNGDYVAMTPGAHWLPSTGTDVPQSEPRSHPYDYYLVDLEVVIPSAWQVAGPGRREQLTTGSNLSRYRFNPDAPVPHVGLFAAQFERRSLETAGITFEVLYFPGHNKNFELFTPVAEKLEEELNERFTNARNLGIPYPYDAFMLVETPNILRGYGGGWRMDTTQTMPGVMMLRENSFPTASFDRPFGKNAEWFKDSEDGIAGAQLDVLQRFFENDFSGGNPFMGVTRNFLRFQTSAVGEGAHAVNHVLEGLATHLLTESQGYFSAHEFESANIIGGQVMTRIMFGNAESIPQVLIDTVTDRPSVWDRALGTALADLEPIEDPAQALNVLTLKGLAIAESLRAGLGNENAGKLLGELINRYRGRHFEAADFHALADELKLELVPLLGDWLHDTALPGFLVSPAETIRLTDDKQGRPRYQTTVHLRNDEPAPGLANISYQWGPKKKEVRWDGTKPFRLPANSSVEIGIVTGTPIYQMYLQPYLSLNRNNVPLQVNQPDAQAQVDAEPFVGNRPSDWQLPLTEDIIIDDLDPGFAVRSDREIPTVGEMRGPGGGAVKLDMDQGLPEHKVMFGTPRVWSRATNERSWGKYRRTHALVQSGEGDQQAVFSADLPHQGRWRLAYYLSPEFAQGQARARNAKAGKGGRDDGNMRAQRVAFMLQRTVGEFRMKLTTHGDSRTIEFNGATAVPGWNDLGEFTLPAGTTSLEISDANTGAIVVADAIRWRPASTTIGTKQKSDANTRAQTSAQYETRENGLARND